MQAPARPVVVPFPGPVQTPARAKASLRATQASDAPVASNVHVLQHRLARRVGRIVVPESSRLQGALTAAGMLFPLWAPCAVALLLHR